MGNKNDKKNIENDKVKEETLKNDEVNNKEQEKKQKEEAKQKINESKKKIKEEKAMIKKAKKSTSSSESKIVIGIIALVLFVAFAFFGFYLYKANYECIATFDGGKVTKADYDVYYKTFAAMLSYYGYDSSEIPEQIAKKAGVDGIIVKLAKNAGTVISDEDKAEIEEVFSNKEYLNTFTAQGIDINRMRKLYNNDYLIAAYEEDLIANADNEKVLEYIKEINGDNADLTEYNTSHILFKVEETADEATKASTKQKAEEVLQRVKNGEDFATLAKEFSEDEGTKENGGKFTFYSVGNVDEAYENAAKSLNDGEVYATLVESSFGYHIVKMDSKVENGRANYVTERQGYINEYLDSLEGEYNLKVNEEVLNKYLEKNGISIESEEDEANTDDTTSTEENVTDDESTNAQE